MAAIFINKWIIASACLIGYSLSQYASYLNYYGCYKNEFGFNTNVYSKGPMSVAQCIDICIQDGRPYALLRGYDTNIDAFSNCYCTNLEGGVSVAEYFHCTKNCPTDIHLTCGNTAQDYSSVYHTACYPGSFGLNCVQVCYCLEGTCDPVTGICSTPGCQAGYSGDTCSQACSAGSFGEDCVQVCLCQVGTCDPVTGICNTPGCPAGYTGESCSQICYAGSFGENCAQQCHCQTGTCYPENGECINPGCQVGYMGESCSQSCYDGSFGENCAQSCHCQTGTCSPENGKCINPGCQVGYMGDSCSQSCSPGSYGQDCDQQCQCLVGTCDPVTGICNTPGCLAGYTGESCSQSCSSGSFGQDCVHKCYCLVGTCNHVTGLCSTPGCKTGYKGNTCSQAVVADSVDLDRPSDGSSSLPTGGIAGGVVGAVAVVAIAVFLIFFLHRRKQKKSKTDNTTDEEQGGRKTPTISINVGEAPHLPKRKVPPVKAEYEEETGDEEEEDRATEEAEYMNVLRSKPVLLTDLHGVVTGARQEKLPFKEEYESIPKSKLSLWEVAADAKLKSKNRFKDILPYDNSRVILNQLHDDPLTSYINASFIQNYENNKTFIAAQGPSKDTVVDFWRMIWEQNICLVVVLTELVEDGKRKCEKYWPEQGTGDYGGLKVTTEQAQVLPNFTRREMNITQDGVSRRVIQHHFTSWPDHGVPEYATPLLNFHKKVMAEVDSQEDRHRVLVHCSAGVGRTGVFLAFDYLLHQAREEGLVDIPKTVNLLREKRVKMVQTRAQYAFLYSSILQAVQVGETLIPCYQFSNTFNQMTQLDPQTSSTKLQEQFKWLETFKPTEDSNSFSVATKHENKEKNRFQNILPTDSAYASLMTSVKERTDYINAVFVNGRSNKQGYIATQMPLADTVVDFWCLVMDYNCTCIVMLNKGNSDEEKLGMYWPELDNPVTYGPYTVTLEDEEEEEELIIRRLKLTGSKKKHMRMVCQFCYQGWPDDDAIQSQALFLLHEKVQTFHETSKTKGPIIVHDIDGVGRCGVYIALCNLVDMIRLEQELDVFHVVETIRTYRPQFITSQEQYQGLYEGAREYMDTFSTYSNFQ